MTARIVVAGATGNLGSRIVKALVGRGAEVTALARTSVAEEKIEALTDAGAQVAIVDMANVSEIAEACAEAVCVVSAVQGLHSVIVDLQSVLLEAAIKAGVPRFIPSDFSTNFTQLADGENRNFDLRRKFHRRLDAAPISSTAIFNGAFGEILTYNVPLLDFQNRVVGYWQDADWKIDFTTMDDTAAFTASAALDPASPQVLSIASFQVSARDLIKFTAEVLKTPFELVRLGSLVDLSAYNQRERAAHPEGEAELYPAWQQSQYMQSMFSAHHASLDNDRYADIQWTTLKDLIQPRL